METKGNGRGRAKARPVKARTELPVVEDIEICDFRGYDADTLMKEFIVSQPFKPSGGLSPLSMLTSHYARLLQREELLKF